MTFEIIPAIDLLGGNVVRLERGELASAVVYYEDALDAAQRFEEEGASRLHVVDLDAAATGEPVHKSEVARVVAGVGIPVQVGGGIRTIDQLDSWIQFGVDRVILGTAALTDSAFLDRAIDLYSSRVVVAIDIRGTDVMSHGWKQTTGGNPTSVAADLAKRGTRRLLVTDVQRDGMLVGPNVAMLSEIYEASQVPVIAAGGVSSNEDISTLALVEGVEGAVVGRALYVGAVDLVGANRLLMR